MSMAMLPSRRRFGAIAASLFIAALATSPAAAAPSVCSYQGQLLVDGQPYSSPADFKFAVLCGTTTLWSNDGTSANGSEPAAALTLPVDEGIFSVLLGDAGLGMLPLDGADLAGVCAAPQLRVWVDAGAGFEQLSDLPLASSPFALVSDIASRATSGFTVEGNDLVVRGGNAVAVTDAGNSTTAFLNGEDGMVGCEVLTFADGTSMSTAAQGGADSDWIVSGPDMWAGVGGNIGIGTSAPDRKLHLEGGTDILPNLSGGYLRIGASSAFNLLVDENEMQAIEDGSVSALVLNAQGGSVGIGTENPLTDLHVVGDARVDGSNGNGLDTRNPNAPSAILRLGWMNDVARLRVGGSGLGSNGGLDIQGTSDASLLRILNNGDATISGNLTVQGTISRPNETRTLTIGPFAFTGQDENMDIQRFPTLLQGASPGQPVVLGCPLQLPVGATITKCELFLLDATTAEDVILWVLGVKLDSTPTAEFLSSMTSSGAPGQTVLTDDYIDIVVNDDYTYSAYLQWYTPPTHSDIRINGLRITYTMP